MKSLLEADWIEDFLQGKMLTKKEDYCQIVMRRQYYDFVRYANNSVTQSGHVEDFSLRINYVLDGKLGTAAVTCTDKQSVYDAVRKAEKNAEVCGVAQPTSCKEKQKIRYVVERRKDARELSNSLRTGYVEKICRSARKERCVAGGYVSTEYAEDAVMDSAGSVLIHPSEVAECKLYAENGEQSGTGSICRCSLSEIDAEEFAAQVFAKIKKEKRISVLPGEYPVILLPEAVAQMFSFLGPYAFSSNAVENFRLWMDKNGKKFPEILYIWDDAYEQIGMSAPFDGEGVLKKRVDLIKGGELRSMVYDTRMAAKYGKESTGHGSSVKQTISPLLPHISSNCRPANLIMMQGIHSIEDMIAGMSSGIIVTAFHYNRLVDQAGVVATGTTCGGTFLTENGKVSGQICDMRYTQSFLEALQNVEDVGCIREIHRDITGIYTVPAVKISSFCFTETVRGK